MSAGIGIDFKRRRFVTPLGVILLIVGLGSAAFIWHLHLQASERVAVWENAIHRLGNKGNSPVDFAPADLRRIDLPYIQGVLKRLNMPWDKLFAVLEKAAGDEIALVSLKPDPGRGVVRIGGEARDLYSMLTYAKRLQDVRYFSEVALADHEIDPKGGDKPVHFQLLAKWKP